MEEAEWSSAFSKIPMLWGVQIVGADLAKTELESIRVAPLRVVESDVGVAVGATRKISYGVPYRKLEVVSLKITSHTGLGKNLPKFIQKYVDRWNALDPKILHPKEWNEPLSHPTHGSHVAGIIGAQNQKFGVSPYVEIEDLDVFNGWSSSKAEHFIKALDALLKRDEKTPIINMSHGLLSEPDILNRFQQLVDQQDTLLVAAVGNTGGPISDWNTLSIVKDIVTVGSFGPMGSRSSFSSFGRAVDIVAPGETIISRGKGIKRYDQDLEEMSGTSMAAPMVTGTLATLRALLPQAKAEDLKTILYQTTFELGQTGKDIFTGHGLMNTLRATMIAARLYRQGLTSADAVHFAVSSPSTFNTEEYARQAKIERSKAGLNSPLYEKLLRKEILFRGKTEELAQLGEYYAQQGMPEYGFGLRYAAKNLQNAEFSKEELAAFAVEIVDHQALRLILGDLSLFMGLSNADLLLAVYKEMPSNWDSQLQPIFIFNMARIAPHRFKELEDLAFQKMNDSLKSVPFASQDTAM